MATLKVFHENGQRVLKSIKTGEIKSPPFDSYVIKDIDVYSRDCPLYKLKVIDIKKHIFSHMLYSKKKESGLIKILAKFEERNYSNDLEVEIY